MRSTLRFVASACALTVLLVGVPAASADFLNGVITIEAFTSTSSGKMELDPKDALWNVIYDQQGRVERLNWGLARPVEIVGEGREVLATVESVNLRYIADPQVNLDFAVTAGSVDTEIRIASALNDFSSSPLTNPTGVASAAYTVTDGSFDGSGATLTGYGGQSGGPGGAYLAQYNGWAGFPTGPLGTDFTEQIQSLVAPAWLSNDTSFDTGLQPITGVVEDMSVLVHFGLTADDLASGTTTYVIVPEPAGLVLLGVLAVVARRR